MVFFEPWEPEYVAGLLEREAEFMPPQDYWQDFERRERAVKWIRSNWRYSNLDDPFVPFLALTYYDRTISGLDVSESSFNTFLTACIVIAHKMLSDLFEFSITKYLESQCLQFMDSRLLRELEKQILIFLRWEMHTISPHCYLNHLISLLRQWIPPDIVPTLRIKASERIQQVFYDDIETHQYPPSVIACAIILKEVEFAPDYKEMRSAILEDVRFNSLQISLCLEILIEAVPISEEEKVTEVTGEDAGGCEESGLKYCMDGEELIKFVNSPIFKPFLVHIFSKIQLANRCLQDYIFLALEKLTVEQGMPPAWESWVGSNIIRPALQSCGSVFEQPVSQETFVSAFKNVAECVAKHLKEQPVILAPTENIFDGSVIERLLSDKFELDKVLNASVLSLPKDCSGNISKEYLRVALDSLNSSSGLPPIGAVDQIDKIINEAFKMLDADDGKLVKEDEFKRILTEILDDIKLQMKGNPVSISTYSVVREALQIHLEAPT